VPVTIAATAAALAADRCARTPGHAAAAAPRRRQGRAGARCLRDFIRNTRGAYQLDMESTLSWLDKERNSQLACRAVTRPPVTAQH
jgi:hypothetical protein